MVQQACPACGQDVIHTIERIRARDLISMYQQAFGLDVRSCFEGVDTVHLQHCQACDLQFYDPPCSGPAEFYEQLQRFDWYYQDDKPEYLYASQQVRSGQRVLDVGCGKGAFRAFLPEQLDYTGLEFNDKAIARGRAAGLNIVKQSVQMRAEQEPGQYDVVCSFQVLEHVTDVAGFVRACVTLLKPGGTLILAVPAQDSFLALDPHGPLNMPPHHVIRWTDQALRNLALRENLSAVETWHEPVADYHQGWQQEVLARDWFVSMGLLGSGVRGRTLMSRVVNRLLRHEGLRARLAARQARGFAYADRGHSVVLVASASEVALGANDPRRQAA